MNTAHSQPAQSSTQKRGKTGGEKNEDTAPTGTGSNGYRGALTKKLNDKKSEAVLSEKKRRHIQKKHSRISLKMKAILAP